MCFKACLYDFFSDFIGFYVRSRCFRILSKTLFRRGCAIWIVKQADEENISKKQNETPMYAMNCLKGGVNYLFKAQFFAF